MEHPHDLRMQLICNTIEYVIKNKRKELSPTAKAYISIFLNELDNWVLSIDSINKGVQSVKSNNFVGFYFTPNLKDIINITGFNNPDNEKEELNQCKQYLLHKKQQTKRLLNNPNYFYESHKETLDLQNIIQNISSIYEKEYHVLRHQQSILEEEKTCQYF